jgi:hypothetical protein
MVPSSRLVMRAAAMSEHLNRNFHSVDGSTKARRTIEMLYSSATLSFRHMKWTAPVGRTVWSRCHRPSLVVEELHADKFRTSINVQLIFFLIKKNAILHR